MIRHTVPTAVREEELSRYIRRAWPLLPGYVLRDLLKKKDVRISGVRSGKGDMVHGGDELEIYAAQKYFEADAEILFDDGRLIAAVKPQGLPSMADQDGVGADTMELRIQRKYPSARLCHRLDAPTGGVMLAALDADTESRAFEVFKTHSLRKIYRAILCAKPPKDDMLLRAYLKKDAKKSTVYVSDTAGNGAKEIVTRVHLVGKLKNGLCFAELEPITGRTHQLRAHMAHISCPILGDDKYGDRTRNKSEGFAGRLCLWCEEMQIFEDSPLSAYAGVKFHADCPEWIQK